MTSHPVRVRTSFNCQWASRKTLTFSRLVGWPSWGGGGVFFCSGFQVQSVFLRGRRHMRCVRGVQGWWRGTLHASLYSSSLGNVTRPSSKTQFSDSETHNTHSLWTFALGPRRGFICVRGASTVGLGGADMLRVRVSLLSAGVGEQGCEDWGGDSEVGFVSRRCAQVLFVFGAMGLPHVLFIWHVCQWVRADDVPAEKQDTIKTNSKTFTCWILVYMYYILKAHAEPN